MSDRAGARPISQPPAPKGLCGRYNLGPRRHPFKGAQGVWRPSGQCSRVPARQRATAIGSGALSRTFLSGNVDWQSSGCGKIPLQNSAPAWIDARFESVDALGESLLRIEAGGANQTFPRRVENSLQQYRHFYDSAERSSFVSSRVDIGHSDGFDLRGSSVNPRLSAERKSRRQVRRLFMDSTRQCNALA
jgi:hypothetical protein